MNVLSIFSRKKDPRAALKKVLGDYLLPSFPSLVMRVLRQIRDPDSSTAAIADAISVDPGLSVRVLSIANSAAFSPAKKVANLTQAVALVGLSQMESLVLSIGVGATMPGQSSTPGFFDLRQFWQGAARRGILAQALAKRLCPGKDSECFTAGLLQDMAVPFLVQRKPKIYAQILERWDAGEDLCAAEQQAFGCDHAEVATWICATWGLPESIAAAIEGHHADTPASQDCPEPVKLAALLRNGDDPAGVARLIEQARLRAGLGEEVTRPLLESSVEAAGAFAGMVGRLGN